MAHFVFDFFLYFFVVVFFVFFLLLSFLSFLSFCPFVFLLFVFFYFFLFFVFLPFLPFCLFVFLYQTTTTIPTYPQQCFLYLKEILISEMMIHLLLFDLVSNVWMCPKNRNKNNFTCHVTKKNIIITIFGALSDPRIAGEWSWFLLSIMV